jgi:CRP-like cAMP-binding protein
MPQTEPLSRMLRKLEIRAPLRDEDRAALAALPYVLRTLDPHAYTIREGDQPRQCAVLLSGFAIRHKLTGDGARQIVGIHVPGDMLDLQNLYLGTSDHNVQMLTRGELALIQRDDLQALALARPEIARAFMVDTLAEASIFREWLVNVGRRDSRTRIAHILCEFALRLEAAGLANDNRYELPMTQEQLADAAGLTPVHVNRTLKGLDTDGLIERDRRRLFITDWHRMRQVGDFSERYLHLEPQVAPATG